MILMHWYICDGKGEIEVELRKAKALVYIRQPFCLLE